MIPNTRSESISLAPLGFTKVNILGGRLIVKPNQAIRRR